MLWRVNPDEEILDWKAVCGRTACAVWREGRLIAFPTPIVFRAITGFSAEKQYHDILVYFVNVFVKRCTSASRPAIIYALYIVGVIKSAVFQCIIETL